MVVQGLVSTAEVYFVGRLGPHALAGATLCFPAMMLMGGMANAGLGGGVSSAIARALGAKKIEQARSLIFHALALGALFGVLFSIAIELMGEPLYRLLGGHGEDLVACLQYSRPFFRGVVMVWLFNTLASVFRGLGQPAFPAIVGAVGGIFIVALSPSLIFGFEPFPAFGIAGAGIAVIVYCALASLVLVLKLLSKSSPLRPSLKDFRFEKHLFWDILKVGLPSSINVVVSSLGMMLMTGLVGRFGTASLAAYGLGTRFEFVLVPIVFGLGTAVVTMVGASYGARNVSRAKQATKSGTIIAAAIWGLAGLALAFFPELWLGIFTKEEAVLAVGRQYFHYVGPTYWLIGIGMVLYFACQGIGHATMPLFLSIGRLALAILLGWLAITRGSGIGAIFAIIAVSLCIYGVVLLVAVTMLFRRLERETAP